MEHSPIHFALVILIESLVEILIFTPFFSYKFILAFQ